MLALEKPSELFIQEAFRIVDKAEERAIRLRLIGAVAIRISSADFGELHTKLQRLGASSEKSEFTDIDVMGYGSQRNQMEHFFKSINYAAHPQARRLPYVWADRHMYLNPDGLCHVDVFFDKLDMSHTLDLRNRLELNYPTITGADLLLEKMQIVRINEKDIKDSITLLRSHDLRSEEGKSAINTSRIASVLSDDWGFWYTVTTNLAKTRDYANGLDVLSTEDKEDVTKKIVEILQAIESHPKTLGFTMRSRVGTKKKWYKDVDETFRI